MFLTRLISGIFLVIAAVAVLLSGGYVLAAVLLLLSLIGYRELMKACALTGEEGQKKGTGRISCLEAAGYLGILVYYLLLAFTDNRLYLFMTVILLLVVFLVIYVVTFPRYRSEQIMTAFFHVVYAPVMLSCIYLVRELPYGQYTVWMIFISSWICDTCAYAVGMLIGKHKMVPALSPKKSIEGAIGGLVGSGIVGALYCYFVVESVTEQKVTLIFALICMAGAVISQIGDLAASAIKRNHNIKDYGKLIPGHGGVMDRFDSVILTAPLVYLLVEILIQV